MSSSDSSQQAKSRSSAAFRDTGPRTRLCGTETRFHRSCTSCRSTPLHCLHLMECSSAGGRQRCPSLKLQRLKTIQSCCNPAMTTQYTSFDAHSPAASAPPYESVERDQVAKPDYSSPSYAAPGAYGYTPAAAQYQENMDSRKPPPNQFDHVALDVNNGLVGFNDQSVKKGFIRCGTRCNDTRRAPARHRVLTCRIFRSAEKFTEFCPCKFFSRAPCAPCSCSYCPCATGRFATLG